MIGVFLFGFLGLAYSIYPFVVIDRLTIWQAASSPAALKFILFGVCISVPAIAGYTIYSYWVFRGKTARAEIRLRRRNAMNFIRPDRFRAEEWEARVQLAAAYRIFDHLGWTELIYNHISLRVPGEDSALPDQSRSACTTPRSAPRTW